MCRRADLRRTSTGLPCAASTRASASASAARPSLGHISTRALNERCCAISSVVPHMLAGCASTSRPLSPEEQQTDDASRCHHCGPVLVWQHGTTFLKGLPPVNNPAGLDTCPVDGAWASAILCYVPDSPTVKGSAPRQLWIHFAIGARNAPHHSQAKGVRRARNTAAAGAAYDPCQ